MLPLLVPTLVRTNTRLYSTPNVISVEASSSQLSKLQIKCPVIEPETFGNLL